MHYLSKRDEVLTGITLIWLRIHITQTTKKGFPMSRSYRPFHQFTHRPYRLLLFVVLLFIAVLVQPLHTTQSIVHATTNCATQSDIPYAECEALIALYTATNGANWTNNSGWNSTSTPCSWYGVTCSGGHVTRIDLYSNELSGTIPSELGNLANLEYLYLGWNQLSGSIPAELSDLINLEYLNLYYNQLSGGIPSELGNLANLRTLELGQNRLRRNLIPLLWSH
jgi:hypothetical protein